MQKRLVWLSITILVVLIPIPIALPSLAAPEDGEVEVCTWRGCRQAAVSYSIDDGQSICRSEMEAAGFRGTYYVNGTLMPDWVATYSAAGHEIGGHTVSHPCDPPACFPTCTPASLWLIPYTPEELEAFRQYELDPNIAAIEAGTGQPVISMAWACGDTDAKRMTAAGYYLVGARGYYDVWTNNFAWIQDVNAPTPAEFMNLNAFDVPHLEFILRAIMEHRWANITAHDSCGDEGEIAYIGSHQDLLWAAPVGEVLKYIRVRNAMTFANYSRSGSTISFDAWHTLAPFQPQQVDGTPLLPIVFDNPVTLRVVLLNTDEVLGVQINGSPVSFTVQTLDGVRYVLFDTPLNGTRHVVINAPTAVRVVSFIAKAGPDQITVRWETATEVDNLGFDLYRSQMVAGPWVRLNEDLIPSRAPGSPVGAVYTWPDDDVQPGVTYYYKLEDVDIYGQRTAHGPVSATLRASPSFLIYLPLVTK
jgi:hypothetical protein